MYRCNHCQHEVPSNALYCQNCGLNSAAQSWGQAPPVTRVVPAMQVPGYGAPPVLDSYQGQPAMPATYGVGPISTPMSFPPGGPLPPNFNTKSGILARGLAQTFGLHPAIAAATVLVDLTVFGGTIITGGVGYPVLAMAAAGLGYVTYKGQINWFGDDKESAKIKAVIIGVLTAIPLPISSALAAFMGVAGRFKGRKDVEIAPMHSEPVQMVACWNCRNAKPPNASFCHHCGVPPYVAASSARVATPPQVSYAPPLQRQHRAYDEFDIHAPLRG